ncbi:hypothetical protein ABBQ32_013782 [Trebouxia sp. C0010 RCD-2024]
MLGLKGGAEALPEACSVEGYSHLVGGEQLGNLSCGSELVCELPVAGQEVAGTVTVGCKRLLLMLSRLASLPGAVLAGCKSSLLTSNSPKISPSSSPDHDIYCCLFHDVEEVHERACTGKVMCLLA